MSYKYPYGNTEQMNLDWFLNQWEKFKADWAEAEAGIDGSLDAEIAKVEAAMSELYAARDAAAASATAARKSSLDAAAAQVAAGNSKTAAQAAETSARGSQQAAEQSAQEAQASAQGAENSALTASQAANTATQQAAGADAAKGAAEAAQQAAEDAQAAAAQSAEQAGQAATAAGDHADDAADSATLAQQAAQDMSDSVAQITTNKNDISDLKESIDQKLPYNSKSEHGTTAEEQQLSFPTTGVLAVESGIVESTYTAYKTTDYISLENVIGIYRTGITTKFSLWQYCFYDSNKSFIGSEPATTNYEIVEYNNKQVTWLNLSNYPNAKYIRISWDISRPYEYYVVVGIPSYIYDIPEITIDGKNIKNIAQTVQDITIDVPANDNIFDATFTDNGYIDTSNTVRPSTSLKYTPDYTEISSENSGVLYVKLSSVTDPFVFTFVDKNYNYITQIAASNTTAKTITLPNNAKFFRVYTRKDYTGTIMVSYTDSEYAPYQTEKNIPVSKISGTKGYLSGKTVVFLGDSIFGNERSDTGVANLFAKMTGAKVHNFAFGGTRATLHEGDSPYALGWQKFDGVSLAQSIANGNYDAMQTALDSGDMSAPAYFSTTLTSLKAFDWLTCEYIIADWGTNDWTGDASIADYKTALQTIVSTILTAYPQIVFIEVTPFIRFIESNGTFYNSSVYDYRKDQIYLDDFADAVKEALTVQPYNLQVIDCYNIGINDFTRTEFFSNNDWTHHDARGRLRIATYLANKLA